jgi:ankyrin repeat protein
VNAQNKNGNTALITASHHGHLEVVKFLLENPTQKANVNAANNDGITALMQASEYGHLKIVEFLFSNSVSRYLYLDINAFEKFGNTCLIYASMKGHKEIVTFLLAKGANVNATGKTGKTALIFASDGGHPDTVKILVENNALVDALTDTGSTALMYASKKGNLEVVKYLVENPKQKANIELIDKDGKNALAIAEEAKKQDVVDYLKGIINKRKPVSPPPPAPAPAVEIKKSNANINAVDANGDTALMRASRDGDIEKVKSLVEQKADVNLFNDKNFHNSLKYAIKGGHLEVVRYLIEEAKAKTGLINLNLWTACNLGYLRIVKYLLENQALKLDVNYTSNTTGMTALNNAVEGATLEAVKLEVVKYLVEKGANVNAAKPDGNTPLMIVSKMGHLEIVKFFVENKKDPANIELKNKTGNNALAIAEEAKKQNVVDYLKGIMNQRKPAQAPTPAPAPAPAPAPVQKPKTPTDIQLHLKEHQKNAYTFSVKTFLENGTSLQESNYTAHIDRKSKGDPTFSIHKGPSVSQATSKQAGGKKSRKNRLRNRTLRKHNRCKNKSRKH